MKIAVVLDNIRSTYNVGAILRSCEGFGVSKVVLSGVTPRVHDNSLLPHLREKLDKQIRKTALGAEDMLEIYAFDDIFSTISDFKNKGWKIVGLENNIQDERLISLKDERLRDKLGDKIVLILGEEVHGIDQKLYNLIDVFVEIPMHGKKESFNVSVAAGVALYGILEG
ncbi:TrmH family RNA methyltransferase [Candidatus Saccharibacteria bacterium]|nr:TrmH family RNA methyltransferase [Candidatus Saccharibacteria bacterium]